MIIIGGVVDYANVRRRIVGAPAWHIFRADLIDSRTYLMEGARQRRGRTSESGTTREVFLADGGLTWLYVAGAITLTNLSTEQLVGMNGNQMLLLAWWEICAFVGLLILAFVFVPIYYRNDRTTVTGKGVSADASRTPRSMLARISASESPAKSIAGKSPTTGRSSAST